MLCIDDLILIKSRCAILCCGDKGLRIFTPHCQVDMPETIQPDSETDAEAETETESEKTEESENDNPFDFPTPGGLRGL